MAKKDTTTTAETVGRKSHIDYVVDGSVVRVVLLNGETRGTYEESDVLKQAEFDSAQWPVAFISGESTKTLAAYGLSKLLQDRTSQEKESPQAKFEAMLAEAARLTTPDENGAFFWREAATRGSTGSRGTRAIDSLLAQAIANLKGVSVLDASAALKAMDKDKLDALRSNAAVAAELDRLKAEAKAADASGVDLSDLL